MDLSISEMLDIQSKLYKLHEGKWFPLEPKHGRDYILFMVEEIREVIAILKKKGDMAVKDDPAVRAAFLEEMADVLMYYHDTLLRYHVTAEEISNAYIRKHDRNMGRDYDLEYKEKYQNG